MKLVAFIHKRLPVAFPLLTLFALGLASCSPQEKDNRDLDEEVLSGDFRCNDFAKKAIRALVKAQYSAIKKTLQDANPDFSIFKFCPDCDLSKLRLNVPGLGEQKILSAYMPKVFISGTTNISIAKADYWTTLLGSRLDQLTLPSPDSIDIKIDDNCKAVSIDFDLSGRLTFKSKIGLALVPSDKKTSVAHLVSETSWNFKIHYQVESDSFEQVDKDGNPGVGYLFKKPVQELKSFTLADSECSDSLLAGLISIDAFCGLLPSELDKISGTMKSVFENSFSNALTFHTQEIGCFFDGATTRCEDHVVPVPYFMLMSGYSNVMCLHMRNPFPNTSSNFQMFTENCRLPDRPLPSFLFLERSDGTLNAGTFPGSCLVSPSKEWTEDRGPMQYIGEPQYIYESECKEAAVPFAHDGYGQLRSQANSSKNSNRANYHTAGKCIDVRGWTDSKKTETRKVFWHGCKNKGGTNQTFSKRPFFRIHPRADQDFCWEKTPENWIKMRRCGSHTKDDQKWQYFTDGSFRPFLKGPSGEALCLSYKRTDAAKGFYAEPCTKAGIRGRGYKHQDSLTLLKSDTKPEACAYIDAFNGDSFIRLKPCEPGNHTELMFIRE